MCSCGMPGCKESLHVSALCSREWAGLSWGSYIHTVPPCLAVVLRSIAQTDRVCRGMYVGGKLIFGEFRWYGTAVLLKP